MKRLSMPVCVVVVVVVALAVILTASPAFAGVKWTENGELLRGFSFLNPQKPVVAPMSDGGAVFVWENPEDNSIYAIRYDADGNEMWFQTLREIVGFEAINPQVAVFDDDSVIVTWQDKRTLTSDIYAQRILPDGNWTWPENGVEVRRLPVGDAINPQIVPGICGPTITWEDDRNTDLDIYAQWVDNTGTPRWTANGIEVRVMAGTSADSPQIGPDGEGGAIITWQDNRNVPTGGNIDVYAQKIHSTGTVAWTANGHHNRHPGGGGRPGPRLLL